MLFRSRRGAEHELVRAGIVGDELCRARGGEIGEARIRHLEGEMQRAMLKNEDDRFEAANRQRDRESKERLAAVKLAGEIAKNPQSMGVIDKLVPKDMRKRLESNEPPLGE